MYNKYRREIIFRFLGKTPPCPAAPVQPSPQHPPSLQIKSPAKQDCKSSKTLALLSKPIKLLGAVPYLVWKPTSPFRRIRDSSYISPAGVPAVCDFIHP